MVQLPILFLYQPTGPKSQNIRIYVMWNDDPDTSSMDNLSDTASTLQTNSSAILKVTVAFTQITQ